MSDLRLFDKVREDIKKIEEITNQIRSLDSFNNRMQDPNIVSVIRFNKRGKEDYGEIDIGALNRKAIKIGTQVLIQEKEAERDLLLFNFERKYGKVYSIGADE